MMSQNLKKLGLGKGKSQLNMNILLKAKQPKKSVWTNIVQNDGTNSVTDVKIGNKLPSTIKNIKKTKDWLEKNPDPILEAIKEETFLSDDAQNISPISPDLEKNKIKSTTNMFNQLMLQNMKSKVAKIAESDSESSHSDEENEQS